MTAIDSSVGSFRQASGRFRRVSLIPVRPGEGRLTEPTTAVQPWGREPLFVPHSRRPSPGSRGNRLFDYLVDFNRDIATRPARQHGLALLPARNR